MEWSRYLVLDFLRTARMIGSKMTGSGKLYMVDESAI